MSTLTRFGDVAVDVAVAVVVAVVALPGECTPLHPLLLLLLSLPVLLHSDLPDSSDQGQIIDWNIHPPLRAHFCSWKSRRRERKKNFRVKLLFIITEDLNQVSCHDRVGPFHPTL